MAKKTLNAGRYGGLVVDVPAKKVLVAIQSDENEFWLYDSKLHAATSTVDYVGMCDSQDPRLAETSTLSLDFRGA